MIVLGEEKGVRYFLHRKYKFVVGVFFLCFLFWGMTIYKDYGISWDEFIQYVVGHINLRYVLGIDDRLLSFGDNNYLEKYFDPAFEISLAGMERLFHLPDDFQTIYFMRHLMTFLMFYIGVYFFYRLCRDAFGDWKLGLLGSLCLILSPRIFANAFYNSKDLPFLSIFIISMYTLIRYLDRKNIPYAVLHALISALAIDIRVMGILIPFLTWFFFIMDYCMSKLKGKPFWLGIHMLVYTILMIGLTILFRPILWKDPTYHFMAMFKQFSQFPWEGTTLYLGKEISASAVPWHYNFVWIGITTPLFYIICFWAGLSFLLKQLIANPVRFYTQNKIAALSLCWASIPLAVVISFESVMYDGWRHMYFIYPAILIIAIMGMLSIYSICQQHFIELPSNNQNSKSPVSVDHANGRFGVGKEKLNKGETQKMLRNLLMAVLAINLMYITKEMIIYHPHQDVYFNILAGRDMKKIKENFELDYWGLSYRKALEYIVATDKSDQIKIYVANWPGKLNAFLLPKEERRRLVFVDDLRQAKYFASNYRGHKEEYPFANEYFSVSIRGAKIMVVYKLS